MSKLSDLAQRPDFTLGPLSVSPARRQIDGPGGKANLEPVIMQVFLLLADAAGGVVTRADLFDQVWGGTLVGDDSLNRAVAKLRKLLTDVAPGSFEIETIPRTGYRLLGESAENGKPAGSTKTAGRLPRRAVLGGALLVAGAAGAGWWVKADRKKREFDGLIARGQAALDYNDPAVSSTAYFRQALSIRPDDPRAWGLAAYSHASAAEYGPANQATSAVQSAEAAFRTAVGLNPREPYARLAQILLERSGLDLSANEDRLRAVLADDPHNTQAMRHLWDLLASSGRSRDALAQVERALALKPLAAGNNFPRAQLLWIVGRNAEADRVIERAMQYWPSHRWVRFARFTIFTFTGRERAAMAMLDGKGTAPQGFSPESIALWRLNLKTMEDPSVANIAAVRAANLAVAKQNPPLVRQAVMVLSALGQIDAAFEVANAQLLFQSPDGASGSLPPMARKSTAWIFVPWLFTPPLAPFRADPRFRTLCDGIGLAEYWATRGIGPDYPIGTA